VRTRSPHLGRGAFTILEILAAVIIVGIVAVIFFPSAREWLLRAGEARCIANMRSITIGLHSYLHDHQNVWPQGPSLIEEAAWQAFWLEPLKPYGIAENTWQCPSFNSDLASKGVPLEERPKVQYVPTTFPAEPGIATRWATQPWLIERANVHKHGPHICFPDGTVKSFSKALSELGVR